MNGPVISATIVAGVLFAGPGLMAPAVAGADSDGSAAGNGAGVVATDAAGNTGRGPRIPFRGDDHPAPEPAPMPPWAGPSGNSGLGMIPQPPAPQTPVSVISGGVERAVPDLAWPEVPELSGPEPAPAAPVFDFPGPTGGLAPQGPVPAVAAAPVVVPQQQLAPAPILRPVPAVPAGVSVPKPAVPVPERGSIASGPERGSIGSGLERGSIGSVTEPGAIGNPLLFSDADIGGAAARALPGLAAILAMTAIGAFLGYRQAKAGHMLRAAGAARFLQ